MEGLRTAGILDPAEAGTAIMEANGTITAFPRAACRPVNTEEMNIDPGYEGMPMMLVMTPMGISGMKQQRHMSSMSSRNTAPIARLVGKSTL